LEHFEAKITVYKQAIRLQALNSNVTKNNPKLLAQPTTLSG